MTPEYLMDIPYYEFIEYRKIVDKELKAEQSQADEAQRNYNESKNSSSLRTTNRSKFKR